MKEVLITSSVLILALLALRGIFRKTISRRVQYALWGLVALRLLLPVNLPAAQYSVLTAAEPVRGAITERMETPHTLRPRQTAPSAPETVPPAPGGETPPGANSGAGTVTPPAAPITPVTEPTGPVTPVTPAGTEDTAVIRFTTAQALTALWLLGAAGMALWFVLSNLRFARFLRRGRKPLSRPDCPLPVYEVEGIPSPCLAGLFRPAIYLTPAVAGDARRERHVLAHELTHARHLDPLWSLIRCLCLTVYWFDPLVWIAAHASRGDCELACDEGALRRLGEGERIPYGETLLSLIPVGRSDPMLSATTMTAGKRQLRERIRRIASGGRQAALAVFAVLCAAAILCAATFTGSAAGRAFGPDGVLSGGEIQYFNESFFNQEEDPDAIRDHFLIPEYEHPEDIDLYDLFYCGVPVATDETVSGWQRLSSNDPDAACPTDILPVSAMDAVLRQYTGKGFQDMDTTTLEGFDHPEEDYYTHSHGDTNALSDIQVLTGERQGDTVTLYYTAASSGGLWHCVTLQQQRDGSFQFHSNLPCGKPAIASRLPETEPVLKLSLADARVVEPREMALTRRGNDCEERGGGYSIPGEDGEAYEIRPYRSTDGKLYMAVIRDKELTSGPDRRELTAWEADCFLTIPENGDTTYDPGMVEPSSFRDLFGHSGFNVGYYNEEGNLIQDYYYLAEGGVPHLLLRVNTQGLVDRIDLDGDGEDEFYNGDGFLYFLRDGKVYEADVKSALQTAWPDLNYWDMSDVDRNYRHIEVSGYVRMPEWEKYHGEEGHADFNRYLYYDGESLQVYKDLENVTYTDHLASTVEVPSDVATAAKALALDVFQQVKELAAEAQPDNWRVDGVTLIETIPLKDGRSVELYGVGSSFHAANPGQFFRAGGAWIDEDGWFGGYGDRPPYLTFVVDGGKRALVESDLPNDSGPGSPIFDVAVTQLLLDQGYVTLADLRQVTLADYFYCSYYDCLDRIAQLPEEDWDGYLNSIRNYYDRGSFKDTMYNLLHSPSGLTEDAAKCYRRLLYLENSDEGRVPVSVELMCESAIRERYDAFSTGLDYDAVVALSGWQSYAPTRAADYPDFHGLHLEVYRVDYYYSCQYPENLPEDLRAMVKGGRIIPSPDGAYVLFTVEEDLHRVRLGDTDIPGIDPASDPAAFQKALEDYFRTEHPGEIDGLGQDIRTEPGVPLSLWDRGSHQAVEDYFASYIGAYQTTSTQYLDGGWELWTYQKDDSWYLFLVSQDGRCAQLPLPVYDGSLRYAEPVTDYQSGGPLRWEARVTQTVYSSATGNLAQESGIYRYELDLDTLTLYQSFTPTESAAKDASFAAQPLDTILCSKSREELLAWLTAEDPEFWWDQLPIGEYWEQPDGAVAYLTVLNGVPHTDQYQLHLRFSDGTSAELPLGYVPDGFAVLTPSSAAFTDSSFTYDIDASELGFPGSIYRYTVDLAAKTVAMTVVPA